MSLRNLVIICLLSLLSEGYAKQARLSGQAPQFTGEVLYIQEVDNPILGTFMTIDSIVIDQAGSFSTQMYCESLKWIYISTGIFQISMLIEPGRGYIISLPPKTKKTEAEIRNPFFTPIKAHIEVQKEYMLASKKDTLQKDGFNARILSFDTLILARNYDMLKAIQNNKKYNSDSLINAVEKNYRKDTSSYFQNYRNYRYGIIKLNSRDVNLKYIHDNYIRASSVDMKNPAFVELFNEMYKEFIFYFSRTEQGQNVKKLINQHPDLSQLKDSLMKHPAVKDRNLAELIILKEIYDIYQKNYFKNESLLSLLDQIAFYPECEVNAKYARDIKRKITRLQVGMPPPDFKLRSKDGQYASLSDFYGKYTYLNFCTPDNYSCLKEYPFLKVLYNTHKKYLNIVTILVTDNYEMMVDFMNRNHYEWTALFYGNSDKLLAEYNVRTYPTCYLLDPKGNLIQSPAALATEGLEQQLFKIMRTRGDL